jgi:hypothetical protein
LWVKAIVLIPRKGGFFLLDQAVVFKRYGAFVGFKPRRVRAEHVGDGVGVALVLGAPSHVDGDFGEFTVFFNWTHIEDLMKALEESDALTAKLTGKREWGGKRPYTSTWLEHYM